MPPKPDLPPVETDAALLARIAAALERLSPPPAPAPDWSAHWAFVLEGEAIRPAAPAPAPGLELLQGLTAQRDKLLTNTQRFAAGHPANHALLWGARGTGKSALVKAVCKAVAAQAPALKLVQASSDGVSSALNLKALANARDRRIILFLDDLSLDADGAALRALKPALEGGLESGAGGVLVYATSNRRHLLTRDPAENAADDLHWRDTAEERLAISDRFGLTLGFHPWSQATYLAAISAYAQKLGLAEEGLAPAALAWAMQRGARSGRTAWQFILDRAGQEGVAIDLANPG